MTDIATKAAEEMFREALHQLCIERDSDRKRWFELSEKFTSQQKAIDRLVEIVLSDHPHSRNHPKDCPGDICSALAAAKELSL